MNITCVEKKENLIFNSRKITQDGRNSDKTVQYNWRNGRIVRHNIIVPIFSLANLLHNKKDRND
jgi:protein subunit release factor A